MENIPDSDNIFRLVYHKFIAGDKVSVSAFTPHSIDHNKISVDWEKLTTPEESLARCGATFNNKGLFKDANLFKVVILNTGYIKSIPGIVNVYHDPIENYPIPIGKPNNPAHSLIDCDLSNPENEPELYQKLREHASLVTNIDHLKVESLTNDLKSQWIVE